MYSLSTGRVGALHSRIFRKGRDFSGGLGESREAKGIYHDVCAPEYLEFGDDLLSLSGVDGDGVILSEHDHKHHTVDVLVLVIPDHFLDVRICKGTRSIGRCEEDARRGRVTLICAGVGVGCGEECVCHNCAASPLTEAASQVHHHILR